MPAEAAVRAARARAAALRRAAAGRSVVSRVPVEGRRLALTFDDGPNPHNTRPLLELLAEHEARATFFVIGAKVEDGRAAILAQTAAAGHEVGNHTYAHDRAVLRHDLQALADIRRGSAAIEDACGVTPTLFRPPFGRSLRRLSRLALSLGLTTVGWSADAGDWRDDEPDAVASRIVRAARPGAIVLLHDGGPFRPGVVWGTARALVELRARGFELVTVSELLRGT
jgi:peptidoglycan/xylan/chitin deacetylase (PgdA/CDA1 family)